MTDTSTLSLGIIVERRDLNSPWQRWAWRPVTVLPGAPAVAEWRLLVRDGGIARFHAATLPLRLHRNETLPYLQALSGEPPVVYVVLRRRLAEGEGPEVFPLLVTAAPYEAEMHLDCGDDIVEPVPMPPAVIAFVSDFVARNHVEEPFVKRRRHDRIQGVA